MAPLFSIGTQIRNLQFAGETAYLTYAKWSSLRFVYEDKAIASRYIAECISDNTRAVPYMMSLYAGLAWLFLDKTQTADQLVLGRYLSVVAALAAVPPPSRDDCLQVGQAKVWLQRACATLAESYELSWDGLDKKDVLLFPPNIVGDELLSQARRSNS